MKDGQFLEKMSKIIPVLFIIYLGFPVTSHSWKIKWDDCEAYNNLYECQFTVILHIIRLYYNTYTGCEVTTNLIAFLIEQYIQYNRKVNFCIFTILMGTLL